MMFADWIDRKRAQVADEAPEVAQLASRASTAESMLRQLRMLHVADEFGSLCLGCASRWPCGTFLILDGSSACPSRDPWTNAGCAKSQGHIGQHGGMDASGSWRSWH